MYFASISKLAEDLNQDKVSEKEGLKYIIGIVVLMFVWEIIDWTYFSGVREDIVSIISRYLIFFISLPILYIVNQKGDGKNFVFRYICLQFPIVINTLILSVLCGIIYGVMTLIIPFVKDHSLDRDFTLLAIWIINWLVSIMVFYMSFQGFKVASRKH